MKGFGLVRNILFRFDAETAHHIAFSALNLLERTGLLKLLLKSVKGEPVTVAGITFPNAVGLAAGLDKNGDYINALARIGFGFIEIGTVTPRAQPGNPKPRLFRLEQHEAIINRMGFNNQGVDYLLENVKRARFDGVLGINIGKNFDTPVENAVDDYLICLDKVYAHADYITVNISSPNTPGLRNLQYGDALKELLQALKDRQLELSKASTYKPLFVKIAPDMDADEIATVAKTLLTCAIDGVIATNTTLEREAVRDSRYAGEAGGLSGRPLQALATQTISLLSSHLQGKIPVIGVGGIHDGDSAVEKLQAGASLVQIYSGFIFRGPELISECITSVEPLA